MDSVLTNMMEKITSCCVRGLKEMTVNFLVTSFQITEPRIQQQANVSKYRAKAHNLTHPCSPKGLTWIIVVLLIKDDISQNFL